MTSHTTIRDSGQGVPSCLPAGIHSCPLRIGDADLLGDLMSLDRSCSQSSQARYALYVVSTCVIQPAMYVRLIFHGAPQLTPPHPLTCCTHSPAT